MSPTTLIGQKTTTCVEGRNPDLTGYPMHMAELVATLKGVAYSGRFALDTPPISKRWMMPFERHLRTRLTARLSQEMLIAA